MTLSVIIVNYNVKYFLEQCLYSVERAIKDISAEIIVIDNNSTDNSLEYLKPLFPGVRFIANTTNNGFAKACNEGLNVSSGNYILFLNPDTIIAEDSFSKCISFFQSHPDCGALGVKMVDGSGTFLKESKRSFPSPLVSLYKLSGLATMFPGSKVFGHYHLGHYDKNDNHEVAVLAGAFFMVKKEVLEKTGSFDELFFMYGEDVDLSYRIQQAGYKNFYVADTTVIHYKGESTRRGSLNYVRMFYQAMSVFVQKHYGGTKARLFNATIQTAIFIRASLAAFSKLIRWIGLPVIDGLLILLSFWLVKEFWVNVVKPDVSYPEILLNYSFPAFAAVYLFIAYYAGLYDRYFKISVLIRSTLVATLVLIALYSLLPETMRFSRGIVLFGALLAIVLISIVRILMAQFNLFNPQTDKITRPYILIAAEKEEFTEVKSFLKKKGLADKIIGRISINGVDGESITNLDHINEIALPLDAREIIFCSGSLSYKNIITQVQSIQGRLKIKIHAPNSGSIIGSDVNTAQGEILSEETGYNLSNPVNRRNKRLIDVFISFTGIIGFPVHLFLVRKPFHFLSNCLLVLTGKKTWIGYFNRTSRLPALPSGILGPDGHPHSAPHNLPESSVHIIDSCYARDYEWIKDGKIILMSYKNLGS